MGMTNLIFQTICPCEDSISLHKSSEKHTLWEKTCMKTFFERTFDVISVLFIRNLTKMNQ